MVITVAELIRSCQTYFLFLGVTWSVRLLRVMAHEGEQPALGCHCAPVHQGQKVLSLSWAFSSHVIPFSLCCPFWWVLCPSHAPYMWLCLLSGNFFSCLCLLSLFLSTNAVNVFPLEAHFMLAFSRT